jgi:hypothetical protein
MAYTGEMVLPRGAVVMTQDEMMYVEGGGVSVGVMTVIFDAAICLASGGIAFFSAKAGLKFLRSSIGKTVTRTFVLKLSKYIGSTAAAAATTVVELFTIVSGWSLGRAIAEAMDSFDGRNNGYIF